MFSAGDIMHKNPVTIDPFESVGRAAALMNQLKIGGLPVVEGGRLVGIITSRDVRYSHPNRLVADAMSRNVVTVSPECSFWEAKETMESHGIERLVVVRDGRLLGVITKSRLYAEIGKHVDALTGLNRAEFLQHKAAELLQSGQEITVIFLDLDNFGAIDKEFGHVIGDEILQQVGKILKGVIAEGLDYLCRYAGDEFAVVTVRPLEEAKQLSWQMIKALADARWPQGIKVTASAGVAGGRRSRVRGEPNGTHNVRDLINLASLASTKAKREKRPVVVAGWVELEEVG
ncbi:diguanylate cyclase (GGDEF) domain-containing protein [Desulfofundulus thermosubterraneus DSM 16057]|uniref:Diguanylate cyclase (GGDEF) domain-containing protein n=2 Tax=Desulfofundulus TaxID=2282741 RepID=A0A1M6J154_9FIRM|nr:diguanylate cyclase (GGDEF) domain-containing protein [Desulfofundulus thermosubterraneus DSM 16057]